MAVIKVHILGELEPALQQLPGDIEEFIVEAVRKQLAQPRQADDVDIEASAAVDLGDDFLSKKEVEYHFNLPDVRTR